MADLLASWVGSAARIALLARHPEIGQVADACAALIEVQDAGRLDAAGLLRAGQIATALRKGVGYIQEADPTLDVETRCALNLIKRSVRDASLVIPWPGNAAGNGSMAIRLTTVAGEALDRLAAYDPLAGIGTYLGNLTADLRALATGIRIEVS